MINGIIPALSLISSIGLILISFQPSTLAQTFIPPADNPSPRTTRGSSTRLVEVAANCDDPRCWNPNPDRGGARSTLTGGTR